MKVKTETGNCKHIIVCVCERQQVCVRGGKKSRNEHLRCGLALSSVTSVSVTAEKRKRKAVKIHGSVLSVSAMSTSGEKVYNVSPMRKILGSAFDQG